MGTLLLLILTVCTVDPYEVYHRAWFYTPPYRSETQSYSNAGIARSYDYDSVIIGSSVTENCRPSVYEAALGGTFVKLCMNGGMAADHARMLGLAFRTHSIRQVVYGIDLFAFTPYYTNQKMKTPDYLYDAKLVNDVSYWFNRDVLMTAVPDALAHLGRTSTAVLKDRMYAWDPPQMPDPKSLYREPLRDMPPQKEAVKERTADNIMHNLIPFIEAHPETQFYLFFPPYASTYWRQRAQEGEFESDMACRSQLVEATIGYPNVHWTDFATAEWTYDLSHYYDLRHYLSGINDKMAFELSQGKYGIENTETESRLEDQLRSGLFQD